MNTRVNPARWLAPQLEMGDEAAQQAQRKEAAAKAVLQAAQAAQKQRQALSAQEVRFLIAGHQLFKLILCLSQGSERGSVHKVGTLAGRTGSNACGPLQPSRVQRRALQANLSFGPQDV